jgi:hypothetical protein
MRLNIGRTPVTGCALLFAAPALAFDLSLPADCTLGDTCHIQNYVDRDPSPGVADFICGPLSYDGHDGTDVALPTLADMARGVAVLAPADGIVRGVRDGMPDIARDDPAAPPLDGRDCGNGVAIDHGDGWETQLCHLKHGSVLVAEGDRVTRAQPVGQIGLSGNTVFPHVHMTVRKDGEAVDPFAPDPSAACGTAQAALWAPPIVYDGFGFLDTGWATEVPDYAAIKGGFPDAILTPDSPALVVWTYFFGARAGDVLIVDIAGPEGRFMAERVSLDRTQAQAFRAIGKRNRASLSPGQYTATLTLVRNGTEIDRTTTTTTIP